MTPEEIEEMRRTMAENIRQLQENNRLLQELLDERTRLDVVATTGGKATVATGVPKRRRKKS